MCPETPTFEGNTQRNPNNPQNEQIVFQIPPQEDGLGRGLGSNYLLIGCVGSLREQMFIWWFHRKYKGRTGLHVNSQLVLPLFMHRITGIGKCPMLQRCSRQRLSFNDTETLAVPLFLSGENGCKSIMTSTLRHQVTSPQQKFKDFGDSHQPIRIYQNDPPFTCTLRNRAPKH